MRKKVLVVEDSATVRQQVGIVLAGAGYEVVEAADGREGANKIGAEEFSLVICDVNMPNMGGIEMLGTVKKEERHAKLPIVMLTTEGQPELIDRAKKAGAKAWIVKPFKPALLIAAVNKLVGA